MPFVAFYHTHKLVVVLFILIYLIKTILLLSGKRDGLKRFTKFIKIPEMVVSALLFITGIVMLNKLADFTLLFTIKLLFVIGAIPLAVLAFRKFNKGLAILAILFLIMAYGFAEMYRAQFGKRQEVANVISDPSMEGYNQVEHGLALYNAQCIVCHGNDGKLNLSGAKDLTISTMTGEEVINVIKNGKNAMPKMGGIYSPAELEALKSYVMSLR